MDRKSILVSVSVGALGAVLAAALLGLGGRPALAGGGVGVPDRNLLAVTTGAPGDNDNRLVVADTNTKRLAVYRILPNSLRLMTVRSYVCDMKFLDSGDVPGPGYSYEEARAVALRAGVPEEELRRLPVGREMLLTTDAPGADGNRIVLVNPDEKRILVYRLLGNAIKLTGARKIDEDLARDNVRGGDGPGLSREDVLRLPLPK